MGLSELSRRNFLKGAVATGAVVASSAVLGACSSPSVEDSSSSLTAAGDWKLTGITTVEDFEEAAAILEEITEFADEKTYDIVVCGAGVAGLPAVLTAVDEGASVACLQKLDTASANGNATSGIILELSDPNAMPVWQQNLRINNSYRVNMGLLEHFWKYSGEAAYFVDKYANIANHPADVIGASPGLMLTEGSFNKYPFPEVDMFALLHGWSDGNDGLVKALAPVAEELGADFYYSTPAVQLVTDASGAVTGVVGEQPDGSFIKLNATKGVILATGDYEGNRKMLLRYCPDCEGFLATRQDRTGDGQLMAIREGARMVPMGHCKQMHCVFASDYATSSVPLMSLSMNCKRFMNESLPMTLWHNSTQYLTEQEDRGEFIRIFDDGFEKKNPGMARRDKLEAWIPGHVDNFKFEIEPWDPGQIGVHRADTLEELASELGVDGAALKTAVDEWNAMVATGVDDKFGLDPEILYTIDTPPYWAIKQHIRIIAINSGLVVDNNYQVIDEGYKPIPGLYAVGTTGDGICGNSDWRMQGGLSNGHCMTSGRYATIHALYGENKPKNPVAWDEVKHYYGM